jgi:very-short-patch-repair endonuclease
MLESDFDMKYKKEIVNVWFKECGIPKPEYEYLFHPVRKWRMDIAWPDHKVYLEVDGGIWVKGGHNRGAQMLKDWEKSNTAAGMGWTILKCQPKDLCTEQTAEFIKDALSVRQSQNPSAC